MFKFLSIIVSLSNLIAPCSCLAIEKSSAIKTETLKTIKKPITKSLGVFGAWQAYQSQENGQTICYMVSYPQKNTMSQKQGKNYLMITHRPVSKSLNGFSCYRGYKMAVNQKIYMSIITPGMIKADVKSKKKASLHAAPSIIKDFTLFTEDETAWAIDESMDQAIVEAITNKATKIIIKENPKDKTEVTYSLKGASEALKAINKACGVK